MMPWLRASQNRLIGFTGLLVGVVCSVVASHAAQSLTPFAVTYISMEHVYLGGGRGAGLAIGDTLSAKQGDSLVPALEIVSLSTHSASCKNLGLAGRVKVGDLVFIALRAVDSTGVARPLRSDLPTRRETDLRQVPTSAGRRASVHPTGSFSLLHNQWWDRGSSARDFAQSTGDLHLRIPRLWGTGLTAVLRANLRRDFGNASMRAGGQKQWTDRLYEISIVYDGPSAGLSFYAGRVMVPRLATIGYFDGVAIEQGLSETFRVGIFGGMEPRWHYLDSRPQLQKYGGYFALTAGNFSGAHFDLMMAAAGEFHSSIVSREALHVSGHVGSGDRWDISHAIELDLNSGWRKENAQTALSLSSLYIDGRYRLTNWLTTGISYDNRKNYWTYETRTIVDSLFDTHVREGIRTRADLNLPKGFTFRGSLGYRSQRGEPDQSTSYTAGIDKRGFLGRRGTIGFQLSSFSGSTLNGRDLSLRVGQGLGASSTFDVAVGQYSYRTTGIGSVKLNQWIECNARTGLVRTAFLSLNYRYSTGEDIIGNRLQVGCTYSF